MTKRQRRNASVKRYRLSSSVSKEDSKRVVTFLNYPGLHLIQGSSTFCGRRPLNHPLPLNDPPIVPLYPQILLRRGHKGQRTEVMRRQIKGRTIIPCIDYRSATPQEVLEKQITSVAQRMNTNGEARKRGGGMTRTFSPLTPIIQRLYSKSDVADSKSERSSRSQRHTEDARRSAPKVKFSKTITEFPDYSHYDNPTEMKSVSSPGQSPSHSHHGKLVGDSLRVKDSRGRDWKRDHVSLYLQREASGTVRVATNRNLEV